MFQRLLLGLWLGGLLLAMGAGARAADRPNFVWLLSEDNSVHFLKLFSEHGAATPHIEKLAQHGLVFEHAFSNSPVCSVARTTLITGCYAPRIGTQFHRRSVTVPMPDGLRMFPAYLRDAGYFTTNNRKKDYNAAEGEGVWDESSGRAHWSKRGVDQPFFHMQSFSTTHESSLHFPASDVHSKETLTNLDDVVLAPYHPDTPVFRYTHARYHDRIQEMDRQIGAVVAELEDGGLLEDTFVFYFGDHGGVLPRSKGYAYQSGLHVPLVVRIPENWRHLIDAQLGDRVSGFVSFVDFGPTVLHLAGLGVPAEVDGTSFLGEDINLSDVNQRDEAFGYADRFDEKYDLVRTLRKGKYEYVRSYQPFNFDGLQNNYRYKMVAFQQWRQLHQAEELNTVQRQFFEPRPAEALYDLENDPHETKDLSQDPDHAETLREMRGRLSGWVKQLPDLSFYPESHLVESAFKEPVEFGARQQRAIERLVEIADLSLREFEKAAPALDEALAAEDPWQRYWACIVCSNFGAAARPFADVVARLAAHDPQRLVRVRAAEFLGLIGYADPRPILMEVLAETENEVEANLVLNTVVLLRDGSPGYDFQVGRADLRRLRSDELGYVQRRLDYLNERLEER